MPVRIRPISIAFATLLGMLAIALPSAARAAQEQQAPAGTTPTTTAVPGHVIVVWRQDATRDERLAARAQADAGFVDTLGDPQFQLLRPQPGQSVADAVAALRDDPNVQTAARDTYDVPQATTNDPLLGQLWGLQNLGLGVDGFSGALPGVDVNALAAWDRTRGTSSTVVADIDTGYRFEHPDLGPVAWTNPAEPANGADDDGNGIVDDTHGADFVGNSAGAPATDGDPTDDDVLEGGHGVHTAGTIGAAGNNGVGVSGVAQDVRIMPLRVCHPTCPSSSQILAINYAGAHGARAVNLSLGGLTANPAVSAAIAANPGVLFVVSAGNGDFGVRGVGDDNDVVPTYPCSYPLDNIVCVAALNQADGLAGFSNFGATSVDVGAPGTEILSTFPGVKPFADTFEAADFGSRWTATGAQGGFARTNEAPLTSFGISDSPGATPVASSERESTSVGVTIPAGLQGCRVNQTRVLSVGGGAFTYRALLDGREIVAAGSTRSGSFTLDVPSDRVAAGGRLQLAFRYTAGRAPIPSDGVWLDDVSFTCFQAVGQASSYGFLDGTSMAAPHVTGAAALLFSLNPSASATQVRSALMATVRPVAALAGRTTTGGRIDAAAALDEIRQPDTSIASRPRRSTRSRRATFTFARADVPLAGGFECQLDGGAFAACASPATYRVRGGRHTFAVRALSPHGVVADPSPATAGWAVLQCKVPRLKGKSLRRARRALRARHCKVGRVKAPRGARVGRLVVTRSKPRAGAVRADGTKVRLTLGTPQPRHRRHGGRRR